MWMALHVRSGHEKTRQREYGASVLIILFIMETWTRQRVCKDVYGKLKSRLIPVLLGCGLIAAYHVYVSGIWFNPAILGVKGSHYSKATLEKNERRQNDGTDARRTHETEFRPTPPVPDTHVDVEVYRQRHDNQLAACLRLGHGLSRDKYVDNNRNLIIDQKHKLLFCAMQKVGCTFWRRVLQILTGVRPEKNPYDIPASQAFGALKTVDHLPFLQRVDILSSYKKIVFVREPYSRLFSGYVDKLFWPNPYYFNLRQSIAKFTSPSGRSDSESCAPSVTFAEFMAFVVDSLKRNKLNDGHFAPMHKLCRPCQVKYDFIGKMENFSTDTQYLLESENIDSIVNVTFGKESTDKDSIIDKGKSVFNNRVKIEKCMPFVQALKTLWRGMQIRGFIQRDSSFPSTLMDNSSFSASDFIDAMLTGNKMVNAQSKSSNRKEALAEAYRSVNIEDLAEYRGLFREDFEVFGYDMDRPDLFSEETELPGFRFLQVD